MTAPTPQTDSFSVPLASGFDYRPSSEVPGAELPDEVKERIWRQFREWDRQRARAYAEARTAVIG